MFVIFKKELSNFFGSLTGYIVIGVFLILTSLVMWVFPDTSVFEYSFATMDNLFYLAPTLFMFLIPAITMRSFAEEKQSGTLELLFTKPLSEIQIIGGKFLANFALVVFAILPTLIYYYSIYQLGAPVGNIDTGAVAGSYLGLFFLAGVFVSIGLFSSALTNNQVVAFVIAIFLCFVVHWGFDYVSRVPGIWGFWDDFIQRFGIDYHYKSISKGLLDTRDVLYFTSVIAIFLLMTNYLLKLKKF